MSQPAYPGALRVGEVAERLRKAAAGSAHTFWPDDVSLLATGALQWEHVLGHRQITDAYLLALAVSHGARFIPFDRRIDRCVVAGAGAQHQVTLI